MRAGHSAPLVAAHPRVGARELNLQVGAPCKQQAGAGIRGGGGDSTSGLMKGPTSSKQRAA